MITHMCGTGKKAPGVPYENDQGEWVWVTRDSREIKISDMDDAHLENTLKMLRRNNPGFDGYVALFREFERRTKNR